MKSEHQVRGAIDICSARHRFWDTDPTDPTDPSGGFVGHGLEANDGPNWPRTNVQLMFWDGPERF